MQPSFIKTSADFGSAIVIGSTTESLVLDFKKTLERNKPDAAKELCRDLAQFANTWGGTLLVGVEERIDPATNLKVATSIDPVTDPDKCREWIEQMIPKHLVPSTLTHDVTPIVTPMGVIVAVNVNASAALVYVTERDNQKHTIECLHRTSHGKEWMNPDEMERHGMNTRRAVRLEFERIASGLRADVDVEVIGGVVTRAARIRADPYQYNLRGPVRLGPRDEHAFQLIIPLPDPPGTTLFTVPYELVRSTWVNADGSLRVLLAAQMVYDQHARRLTFDPFHAFSS